MTKCRICHANETILKMCVLSSYYLYVKGIVIVQEVDYLLNSTAASVLLLYTNSIKTFSLFILKISDNAQSTLKYQ